MNKVVYLETDEEITSVIDKVKKSDTDSVILAIPRGATIAQSIVNLKLLKKGAEENGKEVKLVTGDKIARNLASQTGIQVFSKVSEAEKAVAPNKSSDLEELPQDEDSDFNVHNYYASKNKESHSEDEEDSKNEKEDLAEDKEDKSDHEFNKIKIKPKEEEKPEKHEGHNPKKTKINGSRKPIIIISSVGIAVILILSFLFLPYASADVKVKTEDYSLEEGVVIDSSVDDINQKNLVLPGTKIETEKEISKEYNSTGKKDIGEKASGKIKIYNTLDTSSHKIAKGSKFTSSGKTFISLSEITVPAATPTLVDGVLGLNPGVSGDVSVQAESSGSSYNISPSTFTISGVSTKIYGKSAQAMSGGVTKEIAVVSENDLKDAEADIKKELIELSKEDLSDQADKSGFLFISDYTDSEVVSSSSNKNVSDEVEKFEYSMKLKISTLGFKKDDLFSLMKAKVKESVGDGKTIINPKEEDLSYDYIQSEDGKIELSVQMNCKIGNEINIENIKKEIRNKSVNYSKDYILTNDSVYDVEIKSFPPYYNRLPVLKNRIKVEFNYE